MQPFLVEVLVNSNINVLAVQIPCHNSKNTTNDFDLHKLSGNRNFSKRREVKQNINHYKLVWLEKIANGEETWAIDNFNSHTSKTKALNEHLSICTRDFLSSYTKILPNSFVNLPEAQVTFATSN